MKAFNTSLEAGLQLVKKIKIERGKSLLGDESDWDPFHPQSERHDELKAMFAKYGKKFTEESAVQEAPASGDQAINSSVDDTIQRARAQIEMINKSTMPHELDRIKELAGLQQEAPAAISPNQIEAFKKWYATYSKMQSKDVYNYAKGIFMAHMQTGQTELDGESKQDPRGKAYDDLAKIFPNMNGDIEAIGEKLRSQGVDPLDMEAEEDEDNARLRLKAMAGQESAVAEAPASGDQAMAKDLAGHFMKKANEFKKSGDTGTEYEEMVDIAKAFQQGLNQGMEEINDLANFEFSAHPFGGKFSNNEGEPEDEVVAILNKHGYSFTEKSHPERPNRGLVTLIKKGAKESAVVDQAINSSVDDTIQRARAQIETLEAALKEDYKKFQGMKPYKPKKK